MSARAPRFLDTNILIRVFSYDDPLKAERGRALLKRVEVGDEIVESSTLVVFETVFTLEKFYKASRAAIREHLSNVLTLKGLRIPNRQVCIDALALYESAPLSFADAYMATLMKSRGLTEIYSWDTDFDRLPGLKRVEP